MQYMQVWFNYHLQVLHLMLFITEAAQPKTFYTEPDRLVKELKSASPLPTRPARDKSLG